MHVNHFDVTFMTQFYLLTLVKLTAITSLFGLPVIYDKKRVTFNSSCIWNNSPISFFPWLGRSSKQMISTATSSSHLRSKRSTRVHLRESKRDIPILLLITSSVTNTVFSIRRLASWEGKMNWILCCDWLPKQSWWGNLAHLGLPAVSCEKKFLESHIINSLLTKLVLSRWLDSGLTFLLVCLWTLTLFWSINTKNKNLANIQPSWPHIWSIIHKSNFHQILYMTCKPHWFWVENFIIPLTVSKQIMERKNLLDINLM